MDCSRLKAVAARPWRRQESISMLMLYVTAECYLGDAGKLGFVITQTLFQTKGAGDGFRRFRIGESGEWLASCAKRHGADCSR